MDMLSFLQWINNAVLALPCTVMFFCTAILLTLKSRFLQIRALPKFVRLIRYGMKERRATDKINTMSSFQALFAAMATTIGIGNVVGPSVAIMLGGPGALFWLLVYMLLASIIKYAEVFFALLTRHKDSGGVLLGGPIYYLKAINVWLSYWYGIVIIFLFAGWNAVQANTMASIYALEGVSHWVVGLALAVFVLIVLQGGAQRVGVIASKLVPFMFVLYVLFGVIMLSSDMPSLWMAIVSVFQHAFDPAAAVGAFTGASVFMAMRSGVYQSIFISESGIGTSSIPHAIANTDSFKDQGILAMCSVLADFSLSALSGLLVLVSGVWLTGDFRSTLIYEAFKIQSPAFGSVVLLISITLFILTTVMGNSFNGVQSFKSLFGERFVFVYKIYVASMIFGGALISVPLVWELMALLLSLVAIPNLIGILILTKRNPTSFQL